jgi:hypothetical protein
MSGTLSADAGRCPGAHPSRSASQVTPATMRTEVP